MQNYDILFSNNLNIFNLHHICTKYVWTEIKAFSWIIDFGIKKKSSLCREFSSLPIPSNGFVSRQCSPWEVLPAGRRVGSVPDGAHAVNIKDCWFFLQTGTLRYTPISNFHGECIPSQVHDSALWSAPPREWLVFNSLQLALTLAWGLQIYLYTACQPVFWVCIINCSIHQWTDAP